MSCADFCPSSEAKLKQDTSFCTAVTNFLPPLVWIAFSRLPPMSNLITSSMRSLSIRICCKCSAMTSPSITRVDSLFVEAIKVADESQVRSCCRQMSAGAASRSDTNMSDRIMHESWMRLSPTESLPPSGFCSSIFTSEGRSVSPCISFIISSCAGLILGLRSSTPVVSMFLNWSR